MKKHIILLFGACALVSGAIDTRAQDKGAPAAPAAENVAPQQALRNILRQMDAYVDTQFLMAVMSQAVAEHVAKDPCTPMETLMQQAKSRSSCALDFPRETRRRRLEAVEVYARAMKSTAIAAILFKCNKCPDYHLNCASAFIAHKDGIFVTNFHVLDAVQKAKGHLIFVTSDGEMFSAKEVLAAHPGKDLAIVKTSGTNLTPLPIAADIGVGETVYCLSHPRNNFYMFTSGIVTSKAMETDQAGKNRRMKISAEYAVGSSGAPILNDCGSVVGVVSATNTAKSDGARGEVQMVIGLTIPSQDLLELTERPARK